MRGRGRHVTTIHPGRAAAKTRSLLRVPPAQTTIPRIAHFVYGLSPRAEPFHLVHYLALASCLKHVAPVALHVHCDRLPSGFYWDLIRPHVQVHRVQAIPQVSEFGYDPFTARFSYAHHADFIRLDVLARHGGLYADIDTLFLTAIPEHCWSAPAVIGREADVLDASGRLRPSLSNALVMSEPGGEFVTAWRERTVEAFDGSWSEHSCLLANALAEELPHAVSVQPQRSFHAFEPTAAGLRALLVDPPGELEGIVSVHLMAHLWWDEWRQDFLDLHAHMIDEHWVREAPATYAVAARELLPAPQAGEPALRYLAEGGTTGYVTAALRLVAALRAAGVDIELLEWTYAHLRGRGSAIPHARDEQGRPPRSAATTPTVMHLVPEHLEQVSGLATGPLVVHTVWETDRLPSGWPAILNSCQGVIVPSEWNREIFAASGVRTPIEVIPHVACEPVVGDGGEPLGLGEETVVFYVICRWDERKAPALALQAFLEAFTADDPVALVIKSGALSEVPAPDRWGAGSPRFLATDWQVARLMRKHPRPPRIHLAVDEWEDRQIAGLHARGDCYLTLTHGEGWGIGSFDATAYGNPVIATGWSAHLDYLAGSPTLVDYELVPVAHSAAGSYEPGQRWAQPRLEHAVELLRAVAADPAAARAAAQPLREKLLERYNAQAVAALAIPALTRLGVLDPS